MPIQNAEYPVELIPVDITPYKAGNTGVDYVTTFDSGQPGPHIMISALTHGNELCGAITLDHFLLIMLLIKCLTLINPLHRVLLMKI